MAGFRETPRQKMIGMLYLVLLALLALNVSVQVLDAFVTVNESMEATNENFARKIEATYYAFEQQNIVNPTRVGPFFEKAVQVREMSNELISFLNEMIIGAIAYSERVEPKEARLISLRDARTKSSYDRTTTYFINEGRATIIRERIEEYRENVLGLLDPVERERIKIGLDTEGPYYDRSGKRQDWETYNFYHTILAANVTILNKLINEVQNAEFDIVNLLYSTIDAESFKFDEIDAKVVPKSSFVFLNEFYEADIFVAAYDTTSNPEVLIVENADRVTPQNMSTAQRFQGKKGSAKIRIPARRAGVNKYAGLIRIPDASGNMIPYHFSHSYQVDRESATISADKMNVFYAGVDNPVSISAAGVTDKQINASISVGEIIRVENQWIVKVPGDARIANVKVTADGRDMGSMEFRVKTVPSPYASIAGISEGSIDKSRLAALPVISATMPQDFEFDLSFDIISFRFVSTRAEGIHTENVAGNRLSAELINYIQNARRGTRIWLEDIQARGPDGSTRRLNPIGLNLQ